MESTAPVADDPAFVRLWVGQTIAQVGAQVSLVAIPLAAVIVLHANALQMGLIGAAATLPVLLVALPVGVLVDRTAPRLLLILADAGRALLAALVPFLALAHRLTLTALVGVAAGGGALTAVFDIAYQSYVPKLVAREALAAGNARLEAGRAASQVAGPGLGGALVQALTAPLAVGATAVTFVVSAISLLAIRSPDAAQAHRPVETSGLAGQIGAGMSWFLRVPELRAVAGCTATANFFGTMAGAVYVLFAVRRIDLTPLLLGIVYAGQSVGGLVGATAAPRLSERFGVRRTLVWGAAVFSLFPLVVPLVPPLPVLAVPILAGAGAGQAFARSAYTVTQVSMRQRITPAALLGRSNASMRFLAWAGLPFGFLVGGLAGARVGVVDTLWIAASGGLTALLWLVASPLPGGGAIEAIAAGS